MVTVITEGDSFTAAAPSKWNIPETFHMYSISPKFWSTYLLFGNLGTRLKLKLKDFFPNLIKELCTYIYKHMKNVSSMSAEDCMRCQQSEFVKSSIVYFLYLHCSNNWGNFVPYRLWKTSTGSIRGSKTVPLNKMWNDWPSGSSDLWCRLTKNKGMIL